MGDHHSHGAECGPRYDDENFWPMDVGVINIQKVRGYLVTLSGRTLSIHPASDIYAKGPISSPLAVSEHVDANGIGCLRAVFNNADIAG